MSSVLNGLGSTAGYTPLPSAQNNPGASGAGGAPPEQVKVPNPNNLAKVAANPATRGPLAVLKAIATGQLPGVVIPHDAPKIKSSLTPADITGVGVQMYRPATKGLTAVLFNPRLVPQRTLAMLDRAGKLAKSFPSITSLLPGTGDGKSKQAGAPATDEETPEASAGQNPKDIPNPVGSTPPSTPNSQINDLNLTRSPAPQPPQRVPILPKPSFSADAQKMIANKREKNLQAAGNSVLGGLTQPL